jgi:hypothetical protein
MSTRRLRISLVVTVAFAFTVICLLVERWLPLDRTSFLSFILTVPGLVITELCFGRDLLRTSSMGFLCLSIAFNTLFYSILFGSLLMLVPGRSQPSEPSPKPLLNTDADKSAPVAAEAPRRRTRRIVAALLALIPLLILLYFFVAFTFTLVPPILVRVVDSVSGQPIAGIELTQRFKADPTDQMPQPQGKVTGSNGYAFFRPYVHWKGFAILSGVYGYTIKVNEYSMAAEPWRREGDLGPYQTATYFPTILETRCPNCELLWRVPYPASQDLESSWFVTVPLIPVLDNPDKCSSIANPAVLKQCKDLNTYRSAFLHFDSLQDVENNKAICRRLEGPGAKTCLDNLAAYMANARDITGQSRFKPRQMPMLPTLPPEQVLPFDTIAGLAISNRRTCCNNAFSGSVAYLGTYGWGDHQINVRIEDYLTEDAARQAFSALSSTGFDRDPKSTTVEEIRSGNRIIVHRTPHIKTTFGESGDERDYWRSASKVILIYIFLPRPAYEEAVTKYLGRYPSSLRPNDLAMTPARILGRNQNSIAGR